MKSKTSARYAGVWSATPTPLDKQLKLDRGCLPKLVEHHMQLGVRGLFLAGTSGEGMVLPDAQRSQLVQDVVRHNNTFKRKRMLIAVQATDNSAVRVLDNIRRIKSEGADMAVVAQPLFFMKPNDRRLLAYYTEIFDKSPLPIGFYDRGAHSTIAVSNTLLPRLLQHPKVVLVKDSSSNPERMKIALRVRRSRPDLALLNGDEFNTAEYMLAGYDGLLLGGAVFNGYLAGQVVAAAQRGDAEQARRLNERIVRINNATFGGKSRKCWLAGQKRMCVELGIFRTWENYYGYQLTAACEKAIVKLVKREGNALRGISL